MKTGPRPRIDVNLEELDQIIDGGMRAPLSESDGEKLKAVLHILAERAKPRWRTTEKTCVVLPQPPSSEPAAEKPPLEGERQPAGQGRNGAARFTSARTVRVQHTNLHPGDICPECGVGKVYRQKEPKTLVRIVGRPPLEATRYEMERLRCNGCGEVFTADEPAEAGAEKYDETAAAMIAQLRYGSGVPFKRLERLEGNLGIPLPAATQWGVAEKAALGLRPVYDEFIRQAAMGEVMHNDDTGMRILRLAREPADSRTGIFTSGIVSLGPGWKIALYFSGAKHAGENLAELLKRRPPGLAPLIQMCDALSWNTSHLPEGVERLLAHCMSHGRRQFVEVAENFPEECRYVLETLGSIWHHDALARERKLSPEERLRLHQEQSSPLMPRPCTPRKSGNCIVLVLANRKSLVECRSGAPQSAEFWERSHEKAQARPYAGGPHSQRGYRRCQSGRAGNELVLLSGKQDPFPVPGEVPGCDGRLAAQER